MIVKTPLEIYTETQVELNTYYERHQNIIEEWEALNQNVNTAADKLKLWARNNGPCENEQFTVTVVKKQRTWYDAETIFAAAPDVRPLVMVQSVDTKKLEALAKNGMINADICEQAKRTEDLTPAVTIKAKQEARDDN